MSTHEAAAQPGDRSWTDPTKQALEAAAAGLRRCDAGDASEEPAAVEFFENSQAAGMTVAQLASGTFRAGPWDSET